MKNIQVTTVDEYLHTVSETSRQALETLRQAIKLAAPQAEETISYMMPTYKYLGHLVYFAALKDRLAFYVADKNIINQFRTELQEFNTSGTAIHFTPENPLPLDLVRKIVAIRIGQNEEIHAARILAAQAKKKKKAPATAP